MKRRLVTIPDPCPESWDEMSAVPGGKHCAKCDVNLVDMTAMSERDAALIVALSKKRVCGRLPVFQGPVKLVAAAALVVGCGSDKPPMHPVGIVMQPGVPNSIGDQDHDGIANADDLCPEVPEDKDNFEDTDGCGDPDNDSDRILDATDQCPTEPETYNGLDDDDGCPDRGGVVVVDATVDVTATVKFAPSKSTLDADMTTVVDAIAATLAGNPDVGTLHVFGHATTKEANRAALAKRRAQVVIDALVAKGIPASRLVLDGAPPAASDEATVTFDLVH